MFAKKYRLSGTRVWLVNPSQDDYEEWRALRLASRDFLEPWEALWREGDFEFTQYRSWVRRQMEAQKNDRIYPFFLRRTSDDTLLGALTFSNVRRGIAQSASLGYWIGKAHARQGYMMAAIRLALRFAFLQINLERVEAACLPDNEASIGLLLKSGFHREGYARSYLRIAGRRQDHLLFARLAEDGDISVDMEE